MARSIDQVLALAPDAASATAGKGQANPSKWVTLGHNADRSALWGEVQGSGSKPYQVVIDDQEPAFKCNCPSRKFPCKHGLGLMLLAEGGKGTFTVGEPPAFAADWLNKRAAKAAALTAPPVVRSTEEQAAFDAKQAQQKAKRDGSRDKKVAAGVEDWKRWVEDLVRTGIAGMRQIDRDTWRHWAARMVDAQAPGLGAAVHDTEALVFASGTWEPAVLRHLAKWYAIVEAWEQRDKLSPAWCADVRRLLGWPDRREDLDATHALNDRWWVLGSHESVSTDGRLKQRRTWFRGEQSAQMVLVTDHAPMSQSFSTVRRPVGVVVEGRAVIAPGTGGRGWVEGTDQPASAGLGPWAPFSSFEEVAQEHAQRLITSPWYDETPVWVHGRLAAGDDANPWLLHDEHGHTVPWLGQHDIAWTALAATAGEPVRWFGLWTAQGFEPLSSPLRSVTPGNASTRWINWTVKDKENAR